MSHMLDLLNILISSGVCEEYKMANSIGNDRFWELKTVLCIRFSPFDVWLSAGAVGKNSGHCYLLLQ